jgi:electron transfer flavoprotein alpha subunit
MNQEIYVLIEHIRGQVSDISFMMLAQAKALAATRGEKVTAVLLGYHAAGLTNELGADTILYYDHPSLKDFTWDAYLTILAALLAENQPHLVLLGDTTIGSEVAAGLSARLKLPLLSYCLELHSEAETIHYSSQICGGKIVVGGTLPQQTVLITMLPGRFKVEQGKGIHPPVVISNASPALENARVTLRKYIEPASGDVDITREKLLIGVGRGVGREDDLEMVKELAEMLGATLCASRPVVDQGWLPVTRLVGKSGKTIKPKLYLALGISGAPEHTESITGSDLIIAVNTDPNAPIFNQAKYGVQMDMFDLVESLKSQIG